MRKKNPLRLVRVPSLPHLCRLPSFVVIESIYSEVIRCNMHSFYEHFILQALDLQLFIIYSSSLQSGFGPSLSLQSFIIYLRYSQPHDIGHNDTALNPR